VWGYEKYFPWCPRTTDAVFLGRQFTRSRVPFPPSLHGVGAGVGGLLDRKPCVRRALPGWDLGVAFDATDNGIDAVGCPLCGVSILLDASRAGGVPVVWGFLWCFSVFSASL